MFAPKLFKNMATDETSLFCIDLGVENVRSVLVPCRLPVVAFRLLDLPTVVIHCVSSHSAVDSLRRQVTMGSCDAPPQLRELKDRHGNFVFQKGKSCLFKMDFNIFCRHLRATPLYLMLLDVWSSPAQLIGSTSVRLNSVGDELMKCKEENGICSPSSSGGRGTFDVFNLMGSRVATVELAYRIYNLGPALAAHLETQSRQMEVKDEEQEIGRENGIVRGSDMQTVSVQTVGDEMVFSTLPANNFSSNEKETIMTQPTKQTITKAQIPQVETDFQGSQTEEVYITNTVCPPPLFYNSEAVDVPLSPQHIEDNTDNDNGTTVSDEDSEEEDLNKQSEEISEDEEDHWRSVVKSEANNYPLMTIQKTVEEAEVSQPLTSPYNSEPVTHKESKTEQQAPLVDHPQFSLLAGLLSELSHLLGNQSVSQRPQTQGTEPELQEEEKREEGLQDLASLVYQRLVKQHRNQRPQTSDKKNKKSMATPTRQPHAVETHTDGVCPRAVSAHSPPRPYRNLTYFARFPKKPHPVSPFPVEIPFSKPRERAVRMMTKREVNKAQSVKLQREARTRRVQQNGKLDMKSEDVMERDEVPVTGSGSAVSAGSAEQNSSKRSIEIRLPDVTVDDEMITDEFPVSEEGEEISQTPVEMALPLQSDQQETPAIRADDDGNQSLHIEDLRIQSPSTAKSIDHSIVEQDSFSKQTAQESDRQSDVYSDQFEDESNKASSAGSDHNQSSRQTGSTRSTSRCTKHSSSSSKSSSSLSTSSQLTRVSRDSAMPTVHSMTNLKAIETTLGYTI